ncbi:MULTISPECIES: Ig-like domain-containing protein [unclassified Polaribacter]|uniref:Ig-like domain-containing protein n=1 Tax=unclassified Polaribacter TaxID=196858 RepID=UPI0011BD787F|nr:MULTISPECIES: Ig-like domain-containing protein [unclassified Polaribacter]TXD52710.1 Ig-like domain-containing protein [Polaribacter sp. IC063]TXD60678.1 Ig-like domain-containing protein [Polaribacter sp. IC066]
MTKLKFLFVALFCAALVLQTTSCSTNDDGPGGEEVGNDVQITGISINPTSLSLEEGVTSNLVVSLEPSNATGTVTWSSSNPAVATVDSDGLVSSISEGTASIAAAIGTFSSVCDVTVTKEAVIVDDITLKGSDYYIIQLDEDSYSAIESKVIQDFRPDDTTKFLYVWDGTFEGGNSVGNNFYGLDQDWISLKVGNVGWSGAGFSVGSAYGDIDMTPMFDNPEDYYLHIGFKTGQSASSYLFILTDGQAEAKIAIGNDFNDDGTTYTSYKQLTRDNTWNSIDIPVTHLNQLGLFYNQTFQDVNIFTMLAGGNQGTTLDMDAVFFYKK